MLRELPVLPGKTTVSAKKVGRFPLEKETSFTELLRCRTCWLGPMVVTRAQSQDVVICRMLIRLRRSVPATGKGDFTTALQAGGPTLNY